MAGIGFTLRRVLGDRSLNSAVRAYGIGALVSCGPWMTCILSLALISLLCRQDIGQGNVNLLFGVIANVYAFSLILTGPLQLIVTRYIADSIYLQQLDRIIPNLFGSLLTTIVLLGAAGLPVVLGMSLSSLLCIGTLVLFTVIGCIWIAMLFISAARNYDRILYSFIIGSVISVVGARLGSHYHGLEGLLWGLICGQAVLLYALVAVIALECPRGAGISFAFLGHMRLHPRLVAIGLLFNLAIWIDKLLFWHYPVTGVQVAGWLHTSPTYDLPAFLAYLAIIPGMALFTVRMETELAETYATYFDRVLNRGTFDEIRLIKREMVRVLSDGTRRLLLVQGLVCLIAVISAPGLVAWLGLQWVHLPIFRLHLVAVVPQVVILVATTTLYYLDAQRPALIMSATYLVANLVASATTLALGPTWYGYGLAIAATLAAATGILLANRELRDLEFNTFTRQPLGAGGEDAGDQQRAA